MSGVDTPDKDKNNQVKVCKSCMYTVVQTFNHFQMQIAQLTFEKEKIQQELNKIKKEWHKQKDKMQKNIKTLEEKMAELKKP
jgi:uncharacterized protein YaaN involved in tellurite resistance